MLKPIKFTEGLKLSRIEFGDDEGSAWSVLSEVTPVESIEVSMQPGPLAMIPWAVVRFVDKSAPAMVNLSFVQDVILLEDER